MCLCATGQDRHMPMNLPRYDRQQIHFGFMVGINSSKFRMEPRPDLKYDSSIYFITPLPQTGLNLGILGNLHLGDRFDLRFIPSLCFTQRDLQYGYHDTLTGRNSLVLKNVESTYLEFPIDLKYKSKRIDNYRIYVLGGFRYATDMISQAKVKEKDPDIIKLYRKDYGYEIGMGADFYLPFFKFSPEIKMFNGLPNLLAKENTVYSSALDALRSKIFFISFFFE